MATALDAILSYAAAQVGSDRWHGRCQAFVAACIEAGTGRFITRPSARDAAASFMKAGTADDLEPPMGAAVYFNGDGALGKLYGHVALSAGNGIIYDPVETVVKRRFNARSHNGYLGWGWNGNLIPEGASAQKVNYNAVAQITTVDQTGVAGAVGLRQTFSALKAVDSGGVSLALISGGRVVTPTAAGAVTVSSVAEIAAATMTFTVAGDADGEIVNGSPVALRFCGEPVFYGYVFSVVRKPNGLTAVTCYDQLRYLKNRDSFVFTGTYAALLKTIAAKYGLRLGTVENTGYVIQRKIYENTLLDILADAASITREQTGKTYIIYDDFGSLTLKSADGMATGVFLDPDNVRLLRERRSIDQGVYNRIVLARDDTATGVRSLYAANDMQRQLQWGILQYYAKDGDSVSPLQTAKNLLSLYDREDVTVEALGCAGNVSVRGGSLVMLSQDGGAYRSARCVSAAHTFAGGVHLMDLKLKFEEGAA
ncbi:MAG: hypothetical protein IJ766_01265 [Clostridia bacterium]|nr:hypothetical protein [Clostridia bacterium]